MTIPSELSTQIDVPEGVIDFGIGQPQMASLPLEALRDAPSGCLENLKMTRDLARDKAARQGEHYCPYSEPYYWGGFVLSGKVD